MPNETLTDFARAITQGEAPSPQIDAVYPNYGLDVAIEVYRNNYRGNLHDALAGAYPVIKQLVGDDFFRFMARRFIERYPPHSANLHQYGAELADFLSGFEPAQELIYLPNVAGLEWAYHRAYFAGDEASLDLSKLMQVPPQRYESLLLHVQSACRIVPSRYPITAIWQAHQPGADSDFRIDLESGACIALVSRKDDLVLVGEVSAAEASWLRWIEIGLPLGLATTSTLERYPDFDLQVSLLKLVAHNVFTDFDMGVTA